MGLFRKKEEKKKFDYSDDTKELFAERDAFYAEQRRKLGGGDTNPELADQQTSREERPKEDLGDLLGDSDFNPYANKEETGESNASSIPAPPPSTTSSSSSACQSCGKEVQSSEFSKCPMCGGDMKKTESPPPAEPTPSPILCNSVFPIFSSVILSAPKWLVFLLNRLHLGNYVFFYWI